MRHEFRPATTADIDLLAQVVLLASRSHVTSGVWDLAIPGKDEDRLHAIKGALSSEEPSWCHHSNFIVAEVDGEPAAALSAYPAGATGFLPMEQVFVRAFAAAGYAGDEIGAAFQRMLVFVECHSEDEEGAWIIEWVATLPKFRRRGLVHEMLLDRLEEGRRRGYAHAQIGVLIGNLSAQKAYENVGFETTFEKTSAAFEAKVGAPGLARMTMKL